MISPVSQRRMTSADGMTDTASTWFPEPEPAQLARAVARQRDRGADLAQLARLLVDLEADPALAKREREDQPADPAADDGDLHVGHRLCDRRRARGSEREVVGDRVATVAGRLGVHDQLGLDRAGDVVVEVVAGVDEQLGDERLVSVG